MSRLNRPRGHHAFRDRCHAYRLVTEKGGIPKENVVTFMFNDIAENSRNPVKGNIINHPDGTNNWPFVKDNIDYSGKAVNPMNILAALRGDAEGASSAACSGHGTCTSHRMVVCLRLVARGGTYKGGSWQASTASVSSARRR